MYRKPVSKSTQPLWAALFIAPFLFLSSCQSSTNTAPNGNNPTGSLYFNADNGSGNGSTDIIALNMSSGSTTRIATGQDPSVTSDHKIVFVDLDLKETSLTGTSTRTVALRAPDANVDYPHSSYAEPQVSHSGNYVAYSESLFTNQVYVVNRTDGSLAVSVIASPGSYSSPSWTPDGRLVVQGGYGKHRLHIVDAQFQTITKIPGSYDNAQNPRVSPDGSLILFTMNGNIYTIDLQGGSQRTIISDGNNYSRPIWSPEMNYIASSLNAHLVYADVAPGTIHNLEDVYPNILNTYHNQISTSLQMDWK